MFGGFDLTAGLSSLQEIGEKFQSIKEQVEQTIENTNLDLDIDGWLPTRIDSKPGSPTHSGTSAPLPAESVEPVVEPNTEPSSTSAVTQDEWQPLDDFSPISRPAAAAQQSTIEALPEQQPTETAVDSTLLDNASSESLLPPQHASNTGSISTLETETAKPTVDEEPVVQPPAVETNPAPPVAEPSPREETQKPARKKPNKSAKKSQAKGVVSRLIRDADDEDAVTVGANAVDMSAATTTTATKQDDDLLKQVAHLKEALAAREGQIERKSKEVAELQQVADALKAKNEELAMSKAKVSEHDLAEIQRDFEARLAQSERKLQATSKERDALRKERGTKGADMEALIKSLKEKDEMIKEVMEEGEALSKKQLTQETTIKQLRGRIKQFKEEVADYTGRLEVEMSKSATVVQERTAIAAELQEAKAAQTAAEGKAADALRQGLSKKYKDSEARVEALEATVSDLRAELERQRAASDEREDLLSSEVAALQRQCALSEARQQEVEAKLPEATAPLLRQLESMQETAAAQAAAWASAEKALLERLAAAEGAAEAARQQHTSALSASEQVEGRVSALQKQLDDANDRLQAAETSTVEAIKAREAAERSVTSLRQDLAAAQESLSTLEAVYSQQMESLQSKESNATARIKSLEQQISSLQGSGDSSSAASLQQQQQSSKDNEPNKPAQPGFKWVLVKEGDDITTTSTNVAAWRSASEAAEAGSESPTKRSTADVDRQVASLRALVTNLEATRDRLSEELVRTATQAADVQAAGAKVTALTEEINMLQKKYTAAVELLGEREEQIEELRQDLMDLKESYRHQLDALCQHASTSGVVDTAPLALTAELE